MERVSLREFLTTGRLGPVGLGVSRAVVARSFGPPNDRDAGSRSDETARIWKYGDLEFHFGSRGGEAPLWLIHADHFSVPSGGPSIEVDAWILTGALRRGAAERELAMAGIEFTSSSCAHDPLADEIRTAAGVSLLFVGDEGASSDDRTLDAVSLAAAEPG